MGSKRLTPTTVVKMASKCLLLLLDVGVLLIASDVHELLRSHLHVHDLQKGDLLVLFQH